MMRVKLRRSLPLLAVLMLVGIGVQFYLAGRGAFNASNYDDHKNFVHVLEAIAFIGIIASVVARAGGATVWRWVLLLVLIQVQYLLAEGWPTPKHPDIAALHVVNALLITLITIALVRRGRATSRLPA
jgi:phosphatidylserine synthase